MKTRGNILAKRGFYINTFKNTNNLILDNMDIQNIFYGTGIFLFLVLVGYFVGSYLDEISSSVKAVLSVLFAIILFLVGDILRRRDL